jgi:ABC-type nitrate/sulfonate/bicarbonate transport system permease component
MGNRSGSPGKHFFFSLLILFILWIILFEFILTENNFLPKPGIVLLTIPALFKDYNLLSNLVVTLSAIYLPGIFAYLFVYLFRGLILNQNSTINYLIEFLYHLTFYFPAILSGIILIFWFPNSFAIEYIFSFLISTVWWSIKIKSASIRRNAGYRVSFISMGADEGFVNKNIVWNEVKPKVFKKLNNFHIQLWCMLLMFEYISGNSGLGSILYHALGFHDLSALVLTILFSSLLIYCGTLILHYAESKFIFWSAE